MQRYSITTPLVAIRLCQSTDTDKPGVIAFLPSDAIIEVHGPSDLGKGMIEVSWQHHRYAVFELDLANRATLEPNEETQEEPSVRHSPTILKAGAASSSA